MASPEPPDLSSATESPPDLSSGAGSPPDLSGDESGTVAAPAAPSCCRRRCLARFAEGPLLEAWNDWNETVVCGASADHHHDCVFQLVRALLSRSQLRLKYRFLGETVCRSAWCRLTQISNRNVSNFLTAAREGLPTRRGDARAMNGREPGAQNDSANAYLALLYDEVAEWMPDRPTVACDMPAAPAPTPGLCDWLAAPAVDGPSEAHRGRRYLAHRNLTELYAAYAAECSDTVSYSWFCVLFRAWRPVLRFLPDRGTHSKCPDCEHFKELNRRATAASDQGAVLAAYRLHLASQAADRTVAAQLAHNSRRAMLGETTSAALYMTMDGMDQAKFRVPRNTSQSKDLSGRQRPQLHCVGAIVEGLADLYFFNDSRVGKNANLQVTLTARTLGVVTEILCGRPGVSLPRHLVIQSDNAAGEGKNQIVMKFCAWLVWRGTFESVTMCMFRVGHTHNQQDQRFSVLAGALNASDVLEDRSGFEELSVAARVA